MSKESNFSVLDIVLAWSVHAFTASGIVTGFYAIVFASEKNFLMSFSMLFASVIIDGIDGTFARMFNVKEVLKNVSGKTMDYVIDFATYAIIPAYIIYEAEIVPVHLRFMAVTIILIVSTLYYGKEGMVSNDMYFIGFPVMWNLVAFYLYYVVDLGTDFNFMLIIFFAVLHFVPIKYLYPSRTKKFMLFNIVFSVLLILSNFMILLIAEEFIKNDSTLFLFRVISIISLMYFGALSVYHTWIDDDTKDVF